MHKNSKLIYPSGKTVNKGYTVFVTKLSNLLIEVETTRKEVLDYSLSVKGWTEYTDNELKVINHDENTKLGEVANGDAKIDI